MTDKEAYEIGLRVGTLQRMLDITMRTLKEIAGEDFRGNRPASATKAFRALEEVAKLNKGRIETGNVPDEKD